MSLTSAVIGRLAEPNPYASRTRELREPRFLRDEDFACAGSCNPETHDLRCHLPAARHDRRGKRDTIVTGSRGAWNDIEEVPSFPVNDLRDMVGSILQRIGFEKCMTFGDVVLGEVIRAGFNVRPGGSMRYSVGRPSVKGWPAVCVGAKVWLQALQILEGRIDPEKRAGLTGGLVWMGLEGKSLPRTTYVVGGGRAGETEGFESGGPGLNFLDGGHGWVL